MKIIRYSWDEFPEVWIHAEEKRGYRQRKEFSTNYEKNMDMNLNDGGLPSLGSGMNASRILRQITCSKPRMLTESEIKLLRQSKIEVGLRVRQLIRESKVDLSTGRQRPG